MTKSARWTSSIARTAALLALLTFAALAISGPAAAAKSCGKKVVDDWYADGRVDGTYPFRCYDDAIEILPRDVADYSSAIEDIERALQARMRGEEPPPATSDPTPDDEPIDTPPSTDTTPDDGATGTTDKFGDPGGGTEAGGGVDTASADSVPIPLLVLAGLALLLVAAGSAGYVLRRFQARRVPPPAA